MPNTHAKITRNNVDEIAGKLERREGRVIIAQPGPWSGHSWPERKRVVSDIEIVLYDHPTIAPFSKDNETLFLRTKRGSEMRNGTAWQTEWESDRNFWLRHAEGKSGDSTYDLCSGLFSSLPLENGYEFKINFQSETGIALFSEPGVSRAFYIQRKMPLGPAFRQGLVFMINLFNKHNPHNPVLGRDIPKIIEYVSRDLKTGEVLAENIRAGQAADALYFS